VAAPARGRRAAREKPEETSLAEIPDLEELPAWLAGQGDVEHQETSKDGADGDEGLAETLEPPVEVETPGEPDPPLAPAVPAAGRWTLPSTDLLRAGGRQLISADENEEMSRLIEQTLADYGVEVKVEEVRPGPVVTQFGLVPGWVRRTREVVERDEEGNPVRDEKGRPVKIRVEEKTRVKVDNILSREKDLALALAALSIRFEAPVPGESFVGLEVPNAHAEVVMLRSLIESTAFEKLRPKGALPIALGKGSGGEPIVADLAEMPHLLIAGATGSGKSVCMNTIICSLLMQSTPQQLRLFLVDPKRVELTVYNEVPHLLAPVLVDTDKIVPALRGIIGEMNARYKRFETARVRNIGDYNSKAATPDERLPYIVLVIDELADLMMTASGEVEPALCRLAQLGRATGIHLVVATQRPSVDVLTGLIKANFPSRISFSVSSQVDSRTILDGVGAEKLLGKGDMLFLPTDYIKPKRIQGAFISDDEVRGLVEHWGRQRGGPLPATSFQMAPQQTELVETATEPPAPEDDEELEKDDALRAARTLALSHSRISAPLLQRKLGIGYPRAEGLLDKLERMGILEPGDPGKSRTVVARRGG
jgi:S-DNA-T family DNA segregation ATPase FtsK/SpoIIIE